MTGPEHYLEAERHLKSAADNFLRDGNPGSALAAAQVHATLALAAATVEQTATLQLRTLGDTSLAVDEWAEVLAKTNEETAS
jgi:hypothetical protein